MGNHIDTLMGQCWTCENAATLYCQDSSTWHCTNCAGGCDGLHNNQEEFQQWLGQKYGPDSTSSAVKE